MSKHTPGPWEKGHLDSSGWIDIHDPESGLPIISCRHLNMEANARLIAAAPDLLEALQEMLQGIEEECHEPSCAECLPWRKARAAIAKATGESA